MKKLLILACTLVMLSGCKKDTVKSELLSKGKWVLTTALVHPAMTVNGETSNDMFKIDKSTCLDNDYTLKFDPDGTYTIISYGALCDIFAEKQKWSLTDKTLNLQSHTVLISKLTKDVLSYTFIYNYDNTAYTYTYTYVNRK